MRKTTTLISLVIWIFAYSLIAKQDEAYISETYFVQPTTSISELHSKFNDILSKVNTNTYSIAVYSLDKDHYYYERNANMPLTPASLTKLFSTFNTINTLGADFQYQTKAYIDGIIKNDTLFGSIIIKGSGDPIISTNDLEQLADKIKNYGIKYVKGDLITDGRVFDSEFHRIKYSGDADIVEPTPPISGLSLERNTVTVLVTAGRVGEKTRVQCFPSSDYFRINNQSTIRAVKSRKRKTTKSKKHSSLYKENYINYVGDELRKKPSNSPISIYSKESNEDYQTINVSGSINPNSSYSYQVFINNPNKAFAGALYRRLIASNMKFSGKFRNVTNNELILYNNLIQIAQADRNIWDIISLTNKNSDNYLAENLYKLYSNKIARDSKHKFSELKDTISKHLYLECNECLLNDGSGLSRRNLVTSKTIINLLKGAYHSSYSNSFFNALSIGGVDGTLRRRFRSGASYGNIKAKTGTLRNVSGLAGIVKTLDGENLLFAFIFNGNDVGNYKYIENQLADHLANFQIIQIKPSNEINK
ncbi:MAG TPA: D-alanyl-D-alanine carboxypeptidase [Candidatus Kapabacteria bacterium]|nr:D-alanyl-D-alanine carboxypeptidase [Candidatus Kapabacteria bacterium]